MVLNPTATKIQTAIRGQQARKDLRNKIIQNVSKNKQAASSIQAAIRRIEPQQELIQKRTEINKLKSPIFRTNYSAKQIKRFQTEISDLDKPAARSDTIERRNARRPIVEQGLNVIRKYQFKQKEGRPGTRTGQVGEVETTGTQASMADTIAGGVVARRSKK